MKFKRENETEFDTPNIKERLIQENKYVINVCSRIAGQLLLGFKESDDIATVENRKPVKIFGAGTRAKTLEELYSKLDEIKGKMLPYKGRLHKKGIKNKVSKKKRKEERKLRKTLVKVNRQTSNAKADDMKPQPSKPAKPVFNSEGKIVFSKFDFTESSGNDVLNKKDRETRDPRKLIKKLEKQKEKLSHLEEKGELERVAEIKEKEAWKTALQRAGGNKVKDDPKLLRKTIKKQQHLKKQSQRKWQNREAQVQKQIEEKHMKRKANIDEHLRKKKVKKAKKLVKRGRIIPGY